MVVFFRTSQKAQYKHVCAILKTQKPFKQNAFFCDDSDGLPVAATRPAWAAQSFDYQLGNNKTDVSYPTMLQHLSSSVFEPVHQALEILPQYEASGNSGLKIRPPLSPTMRLMNLLAECCSA